MCLIFVQYNLFNFADQSLCCLRFFYFLRFILDVFYFQVYDMTTYLSKHPGGTAMMRQAGKDGTLGFSTVKAHSTVSSFIDTILEERLVGSLEKSTDQDTGKCLMSL